MLKKILAAILFCSFGVAMSAQTSIESVLESIEKNNVTLKSRNEAMQAKNHEARSGNSLGDLSVSFGHMWGKPSTLGRTREFAVSQAFDFPTTYITRNRMVDNVKEQNFAEYMAERQQILQEAKELYIELFGLRELISVTKNRLELYEKNKNLFEEMHQAGNATVLDKAVADMEYVLLQEVMTSYNSRAIEIESTLTALNGGEALDLKMVEPKESLRPYDEVLAAYKESDPTMIYYRSQESTSSQAVKLSRSQFLPKFEIGYKNEGVVGVGERFNGITAGISMPIFSNRHNVRRAKAEQASARLETRQVEVTLEAKLRELYDKAELYENTLKCYESFPGLEPYVEELQKAVMVGEISVISYFSELNSLYDAVESRIRMETECRTIIARINVVYL